MRARTAFVLVSGAVLAFLLFAVVLRPAVERGGWGELALLALGVVAVLLVERWLRSR